MANLTSFMLCDSINNVQDPKNMGTQTNLVSPQMLLRPQYIPSTFSFGVSFGISDIDLGKQNKIKLCIKKPDGNDVQEAMEAEFPVLNIQDRIEKKYQGYMINIDIRNMLVDQEGEYVFEIHVNDENIAKQIVPIFKRYDGND